MNIDVKIISLHIAGQPLAAKRRKSELLRQAEVEVTVETEGQCSSSQEIISIEDESTRIAPVTEILSSTCAEKFLEADKAIRIKINPPYRNRATMTSFASSTVAPSPFIIPATSTVISPSKYQQRKRVESAFVVSSHETISSSSGSELECDEGSDYKKSETSGRR
ncbi:hypothetical protein JTB14_017036 [Gonioctena quinquepunctata]|nr:hypothetical protein JTB14_017036 [Gonioctena quinquepunctata]